MLKCGDRRVRFRGNPLRKDFLDSAREFCTEVVSKRDDVWSVFLCGSVVEGLDDLYSDFDVRVVTDYPPSKETLIKKDIALSIWYLPRSDRKSVV